jgi:ribosomal protein L16 Arg81 hydroxylase
MSKTIDRRHASSRSTATMLSEILTPFDAAEFRASVWGQRPLVVPGPSTKFASLFTFDSLNRILNESPFPHPTVKLTRNGRTLQSSTPEGFVGHIRGGATLVLENAERYDATVAGFLDRLSAELCFATRANVYFSQPRQQGYQNHYDTHDFFILQVEGEKDWFIFPATVEEPLFDQKHHGMSPPPESEIVLQCTLTRGDVLYVPKGMWHYACATGQPSVHLTIALFQRTGIDFLTWLVNELRDDETFRRRFPLITRDELPSESGAAHPFSARVESLARALTAALEDSTLAERYTQFLFASLRNHRPFAFPARIYEPDLSLSATLAVTHRAFLKQMEDSTVTYTGYGTVLRFDAGLERVVDQIFASERISGAALRSTNPAAADETVLAVLKLLAKHGFVVPQESSA